MGFTGISTVGPTQGCHADKQYGVPDPAEPQIKDYGGKPGPARTLTGNRSGRAALRREQREQLGSNRRANRATEKVGEVDHRCHKHSMRKRRHGDTPEGAMRHVEPLQ
jgi:hypothetical protein